MKPYEPIALIGLLLFSVTAYGLDGWKLSSSNDLLIYSPQNLKKVELLKYAFSGPYEVDRSKFKSWFEIVAGEVEKKLGNPLRKGIAKQGNGTWSMSNSIIDKNGRKLNVAYEGGYLSGDKTYFMCMITNINASSLLKYGVAYKNVLHDAKQHLRTMAPRKASVEKQRNGKESSHDKSQKEKPQSKQNQIKAAIRTAPGQGVDLSDVEVVWVHTSRDYVLGGMDVDSYLLLEDGSVYMDLKIPPNELNVKASKALQPKQWSVWRKSWGNYQIKDKKTNHWKTLEGGPGGAIAAGSKIAGRYLNAGGSQIMGAWKRNITFSKNGRFDMDSFTLQGNDGLSGGGDTGPLITVVSSSDKHGSKSASSTIGDNVGGGGSSKINNGSKNTGHYQISDYSITLIHDNGWKHNELFLYEDTKDTFSIIYVNDVYYHQDD